MKRMHTLPTSLLWVALLAGTAPAQNYAPPPGQPLEAETRKALEESADRLAERLVALRRQGLRDPHLAHVEVYYKAARWILRHGEFFHKDSAKWTAAVLDEGVRRADLVAKEQAPWLDRTGHPTSRAYRSRLDGAVQPYSVALPADYGKVAGKKYRLDVVLHGRDASLTEVKFLNQHDGSRPSAAPWQDVIQLEVYGRGNNAYRWAGEIDVREAVDDFLATEHMLGRGEHVDLRRTVLRGFSMGGAGTWHLGLHSPSTWSVLGPGAGFTTTHGYIKGLPEKLPPYQESTLSIYDAVAWAENAAAVPVVAYGGSEDPQLQAARNIEAAAKPFGIPVTVLVAPGLPHRFPPEWQEKAEKEYSRYTQEPRPEYPKHVRFVTYTVRYGTCNWVEVLGLEQHYRRALVDATAREDGFDVKTTNVRILHLGIESGVAGPTRVVNIDGQKLEVWPTVQPDGSKGVYLEKQAGKWTARLPQRLSTDRLRRPQKTPRLQGPIDDAFMDSFLCVRGTGKPWNVGVREYADAALARFESEWDKYLRGTLPVKDDVEVTAEDIATRHLILFGDPASNSLIAQVVGALPLQWTPEQIKLGADAFSARDHVPVLIYPSPLNPMRYVVLNSGHTFHAADFRGTNALLYPRLGDYAVLRPNPSKDDPLAVEVRTAGLFDEGWQLPEKP